ncbi:MAG: MATE family efflux transporter [Polyangiaceae bacterium]
MKRLILRLKLRLKRWVAFGASAGGRPRDQADRNTNRELVALAWPIATAMLGDTLMGLVDTKLVGHLGSASLGGVGIATVFFFLIYAIVFGLVRGVKIRVAYAVGGDRLEDAARYVHAGLFLSAIAGVIAFVLGRDVSWALSALSVDPEIVAPARAFLAAITFGSPATCMLAALVQHRQAIGDSRTPMIVGLAGNAFNAVLAYSMIYGKLGLPALGVVGCGYATAITQWIELAALLTLFVLQAKPKRKSVLSFRAALREVAELGVPTGAQFGFEMLAFTAFTAILGNIGKAQIAAHMIALNTIRASFLPGVAIGEAASVMVGVALGSRMLARERLAEADRITRAALRVAITFMAMCGVVFALFGGTIAALFTDDVAVLVVARKLLLIAAVFQVLDAVNIVLRGALRGAKDVRVVAFLGITIVWTCIPTAAFVLGKVLGWGAIGGWCGFIAETTLSAILFGRRWARGAWRAKVRDVVPPETEITPEMTPEMTKEEVSKAAAA